MKGRASQPTEAFESVILPHAGLFNAEFSLNELLFRRQIIAHFIKICAKRPALTLKKYPASSCSRAQRHRGLAGGSVGLAGVNFSAQRTRPVICITTKSVMIEPMVTARPVKPLKKKA